MIWLSFIVLFASIYCINGVSSLDRCRSFGQEPCVQRETAGCNCCPGLLLDNNGNCVLASECPNYGNNGYSVDDQYPDDSLEQDSYDGMNQPDRFGIDGEAYDKDQLTLAEQVMMLQEELANQDRQKNPKEENQKWGSWRYPYPYRPSDNLLERYPTGSRPNSNSKNRYNLDRFGQNTNPTVSGQNWNSINHNSPINIALRGWSNPGSKLSTK